MLKYKHFMARIMWSKAFWCKWENFTNIVFKNVGFCWVHCNLAHKIYKGTCKSKWEEAVLWSRSLVED